MLSKTVKSLRKAGVEGCVVNDESADANSFISFDLDLQSNNISVPVGGQREDSRKRKAIVSAGMAERDNNNCIQLLQRRDLPASAQEDRKKDKAIVSADMVERDENKFVQLLQRGKRMRVNSSSSREVNKFTVCEDSNPCSSSDFATQRKIQDCRNDVVVNSSRDDTSERNINFYCKPQGFSRVHRNERQLARLENTRGGLLSLSKAGDQGISSEAGSPEVIFLGSRTSTQRNHSFTRENSDIVKELSRGVEVDDHTPIDVDSLEYTINETVNLEESNKETSARARQIEQDELLARRIQEVLVREKGERGVQQDDLLSDLVVQRELKEHRVDVLEVTEHAVERNATHRFLAGGQRDFNENDYDKLLVLDDDNSNWKGASQQHIDGLPISTVQNDISDEVCSVCLEKQKAGDVIRHLLCTHKFHKECIDPWLAIQASCPICKLSVKARQLCRRQPDGFSPSRCIASLCIWNSFS